MWPTQVLDQDGQELEFVRQYGNHAEYRQPDNKTLWLSYNSVGALCHGAALFTPLEEKATRCVAC